MKHSIGLCDCLGCLEQRGDEATARRLANQHLIGAVSELLLAKHALLVVGASIPDGLHEALSHSTRAAHMLNNRMQFDPSPAPPAKEGEGRPK